MNKICRYAMAELLDNNTILVKGTKVNKEFLIKDNDEIISFSFDTKRFYDVTEQARDELNDFAVNYTTKLVDGKNQYFKCYVDRTTLEITGSYKAKPINRKK